MILAKVLSRVVSSAKSSRLPYRPMLTIQALDGLGDRTPMITLDGVGAGPGDTVLVLQEGTGAREVLLDDPSQPMPCQMVIVGIVDEIQSTEASILN
jgi:microcompartment protein CcmK/EutM